MRNTSHSVWPKVQRPPLNCYHDGIGNTWNGNCLRSREEYGHSTGRFLGRPSHENVCVSFDCATSSWFFHMARSLHCRLDIRPTATLWKVLGKVDKLSNGWTHKGTSSLRRGPRIGQLLSPNINVQPDKDHGLEGNRLLGPSLDPSSPAKVPSKRDFHPLYFTCEIQFITQFSRNFKITFQS